MKQTTLPFSPEENKPSKPKLDDRGYPTEASPEQMAVLHDKVMTNRYISGANKFGEYPKPKTTMQLRREAHQQKIKDNQKKIKDNREKKKTDKELIQWALEESSETVVKNPYLKKAITDAEIQEKLDKLRGPSDWQVIYDGMSPQEKGSWNTEQRKKGFNGKTADPIGSRAVSSRPFPADAFTLSTAHEPKQDLTTAIPKEVNQIMNNEIENIRQMRMDAERLRRMPEVKFKTRKPEPAGLHEAFTQDKLIEGSILKQIREDFEKI